VNYHGRIMNISTFLVPDEGYRIGHRDARHAAAEIANEADAEIERLRGLLRELRDRCETNGMGMIGIGHRIQVALGERAADVSEEQR
jgi:hypothetical protein